MSVGGSIPPLSLIHPSRASPFTQPESIRRSIAQPGVDLAEAAATCPSTWGVTFKKMETDNYGDPSLHGHSGPVSIRRFDYNELTPSHAAFIETAKALRFPEIDANGAEQFGVGRLPMNIGKNGTRLSTALTYLTNEVWRRDNLTIRGETLVNTVRFEHRRATGVRLVGGEE